MHTTEWVTVDGGEIPRTHLQDHFDTLSTPMIYTWGGKEFRMR